VPLVLLRRSGVGPADEAVTRTPRTRALTKPDLETMGIISLVIGVVLWILGAMDARSAVW
jgi:hypothetical protein